MISLLTIEGWAQQPKETSTTGGSTRTAAPGVERVPTGARPAAHRRYSQPTLCREAKGPV